MARHILSPFLGLKQKITLEYITKWIGETFQSIGLVEEWIEIGGSSGEPAFANGWQNAGSGFATAAFYKDPYDRVHLRGTISGATGNVRAFTLPTQYRPNAILVFAVAQGATNAQLIIDFNGYVIPSSSGQCSLDGISFRAEADANASYYTR